MTTGVNSNPPTPSVHFLTFIQKFQKMIWLYILKRQKSRVGILTCSWLPSYPKDVIPVPLGSSWVLWWLQLLLTLRLFFLQPACVIWVPLFQLFFVAGLPLLQVPKDLEVSCSFFDGICSGTPLCELCWASHLSSKLEARGFCSVSHWCLFYRSYSALHCCKVSLHLQLSATQLTHQHHQHHPAGWVACSP